jgi:hypothetical protein
MTGVGVQARSLAELVTSLKGWWSSLRGWATKVGLRGIEEKRWREARLSHIAVVGSQGEDTGDGIVRRVSFNDRR